jgi:hypothetical protein
MKAALIYCPFFTNGDYPPLGMAYINGALREAGHETAGFDFAWLASRESPEEFHLIREFFAVNRVKDEVVFALGPELGLFLLYGEDDRKFKWQLSYDAEFKPAAIALCLSLRHKMPEWAETVLAQNPDAALFSTYSSNCFVSLYMARLLKKMRPDLPVVFGGPGASLPALGEFILSTGFVDALVVGEGEITVRELCADLKNNLERGIPGLAVLKKNKMTCVPRPMSADLDFLPRASFEGLPFPGREFRAYRQGGMFSGYAWEGFPISSTRGCVNRCAYCSESVYWQKFRQRKPASVVADMKEIYQRFGETTFAFNDSSLNGKPGWLEEFCAQLPALPFKPRFWCYLIPNQSITDQLAIVMFESGFLDVTLGVETFSGSIRKRINKGMEGEEIFRAILSLTRAGVNVTANLLVGFPGETDEEFESSMNFIRRWDKMNAAERGPGNLHFEAGHRVRVEAYSRFFQDPEKFGIRISPYEIPLPESLSGLKQPLSGMLLKARMSVDEKTISRRIEAMRKLASKTRRNLKLPS